MMKKLLLRNVHPIERVFRVVLGLGILALLFVGPHTWWGLLGLVPLATGFVGSCPVYRLLGVNTCGRRCQPTQDAPTSS